MIGNPGHQPIPALCTALEVKFRLAGQGFDGTQDNGDVVRPRLRQAVAVNSPKPVEPSKQRLPNQYSAKPHRLVGPERRAAKMPSIWVPRPKGATITLRRDAFPLVERGISNRFDSRPLLHAFRPPTFGFLIARISNGIVCNCVEPALLLYRAENFVFDPVFQTKMQRSLARSSLYTSLFLFQKSRTTIVKNIAQ